MPGGSSLSRKDWLTIALLAGGLIIGIIVATGAVGDWFKSMPFSGEVVEWRPVDEANVQMQLRFTNEGDAPARGQCLVEALDASRVVGFDIFSSTAEIRPGSSETYSGALRIEDLGGFRVADVVASDCKEAT